ncbi:uncharacterized protein N7482_001384 [Penicillium canariense]|uniref:WD repeat-containing protein 75 second beta-propeller domain-containing protein n=1 Tax=Penicillium canariense TaxID=189055 RepID=A0A9W9IFI5_9EURO|nr:uncharacterized protein N7482_001384 [Penicillium canariense]KAJ5175507.1 hypothetical protein N7482_001384 [Penicillium canariense]
MAPNQSARHQKRSRASDAAEKVSRPGEERTKRRRTSDVIDVQSPKEAKPASTAQDVSNDDIPSQEVRKRKNSAPWSFSRPVGGRYSNLDPVMTVDEAYLFLGLDTSVQVFATSTSRLLRTLQMEAGQKVIGYQLCPIEPGILYIFTSGFVTKWDWDSGKRLARWGADAPTVAVDLPAVEKKDRLASYSIVSRKDGKRQILVNTLGDKTLAGVVALETAEPINTIRVACEGRVIVACDGSHLFLGTTHGVDHELPESTRYTWRATTLPAPATCFHLRESSNENSEPSDTAVDLVVGETGGYILIYQDILNTLFCRNAEKKSSPRKLHWHRGAVSSVRWSRDGNYLISGGQESVLVLWQLDTGRKQFLPHLSSPICNIVVSPNGNSYVVKLADNSVMVLSARELQPSANVTGLQLSTEISSYKDSSSRRPFGAVATLHPQHPERLLVTVPASYHISQQGHQRPSSAVLQTFDIRSNSHISRQALARTNATTLDIGPEGTPIVAPDVRQMDIVEDGKWLATVDSWTPNLQDVEAVTTNISKDNPDSSRPEVFLKFWKWNASADNWELVTRIDGPHFSDSRHSTVLGLAARPCSHEFVTLGADAFLRFWCPTARHRSGLKTDASKQNLDTWKCRSIVDMSASLDNASPALETACMGFSEDGSVLAVCLPSRSGADEGLVLLIDARNGTVHYRRTGVFFGKPYSAKFLGKYLIVASSGSVAGWDTVDDVVKPIQLTEYTGSVDPAHQPLVTVNTRTQTFAIALRSGGSSTTDPSKKRRKARYHIRIYDVPSFDLVFQETLGSNPLALLSDAYSGDYIVVDSTASVQRLGCLDKASQKSLQPQEVTSQLNSGLASIFSRGHERVATQPADEDTSASQNKALASVFGDTPSFALPSIGVLFRKVVQTLGSS